MWSILVWNLRHGYNLSSTSSGPLYWWTGVDTILELQYDFELGVVMTIVSVIDAILELRHYDLQNYAISLALRHLREIIKDLQSK